jgi:hypothetical protein
MKQLTAIIITGLFLLITVPAQVKTTEEKVSVDKDTGDTTHTSSVTVSLTEDITLLP